MSSWLEPDSGAASASDTAGTKADEFFSKPFLLQYETSGAGGEYVIINQATKSL